AAPLAKKLRPLRMMLAADATINQRARNMPTATMAKGAEIKPALDWLKDNHDKRVDDLAALVAIPSVSTDGKHKKEIDQSAKLTSPQMRAAGLHNGEVLRVGDSNPYAYGEWLDAPGQPTVFLYAHHDVQPAPQEDVDSCKWQSKPWELTRKSGRLYGRGS